MYGIFTNIYPKNHPNVGKYTIHGASGNYCTFLPPAFRSCNAACDAGPLVVSRKLAGRNRKSSSQAHEVSLDSAGKLPIPSKHWKKRNINQYNNKPPMTGNGEHTTCKKWWPGDGLLLFYHEIIHHLHTFLLMIRTNMGWTLNICDTKSRGKKSVLYFSLQMLSCFLGPSDWMLSMARL
jgi:hypothetical protein